MEVQIGNETFDNKDPLEVNEYCQLSIKEGKFIVHTKHGEVLDYHHIEFKQHRYGNKKQHIANMVVISIRVDLDTPELTEGEKEYIKPKIDKTILDIFKQS